MKAYPLKKIDPIPVLLVLAALFLSLDQIEKSGYLNAYYTAATVSMTQSLHNFFYNSFDPGGFISIDKPPVAFWLQAISVKLLGLHAWSLALPSALAFAGSVALLYAAVRLSLGLPAARLAALILTLTPIAAAVSRTNNVDSVLLFFLMLAVYVLIRAVRSGRVGQLCLAFAWVGIGFNVKMLEAYLVLPTFVLYVLAASCTSWKRRLVHLGAASAVLIAVSLSWAVAVDSTPADNRPYVGSSLHNSVLELALGYNGIGRLTGNLGGSLSAPLQAAQEAARPHDFLALAPSLPLPERLQAAGAGPASRTQTAAFASPSTAGSMSSAGEDGPPGPLRLLDVKLAGQISWLLPFALFGAVLLWVRRPRQRAEVLLWTGWLLPMMAVFSLAGYFHRYYLIMLAPAIAALAGAAIAELCRSRKPAWLLGGCAIAFGTAAYIAADDGFARGGWTLAAAGMLAAILALAFPNIRIVARGAFALGLSALLAAPGFWSLTPSLYGGSARQPYASPHLAQGDNWSHDGRPLDPALVDYLLRHRGAARYAAAMPSSNSGADALIIQTGEPVLAWGGFKGVDPAIGLNGFRRLIAAGQLRYVLLGGTPHLADPIARWVEQSGTVVPETVWNPGKMPDPVTRPVSDRASVSVLGVIGRAADAFGLHPGYTLYEMRKEDASLEHS
ncbi:glycosyltransferase family 39 protein [Saccharibacillus qingshengii]|uniref:glycosyltransferase family 39 protein n=1 Tax=Saccharibacillus qingshengii TaxID=1763540 RepID=UPI0015566680|nr:glycosyltransferase family 39 protein [Saccharibacillus qingshengii]